MDFLKLPKRTNGDRFYGVTSITDFGIPIGNLENHLNDYHQYIDIAKLGVGSAYVTPNIDEKINLYKEFNIKVYFGGTLFEKFFLQGKIDEYISYLKQCGIEWVEVSNGTLDIPLEERLRLVDRLKGNFQVIGEVGSKDAKKELTLLEWAQEMNALLDAGCKFVITEGRDSGTSGIYNENGEIKSQIVLDLVKKVDAKKIIFEAPTSKHQMFFINQLGANVNLGNVRPQDILLLEAQRCGLRSETFFMGEGHEAISY